ncbi:ATP synthase F1 subunit delta [Saccharibacter sp. 17.LH.SD]|uniref:ATP synthase F1 subunit delta n=1 Tax=Saccharibacter sp. 17.LH.SD TaxID=2689393 RepID=UPI00136EC67A|nr:ATP synthase F1 subunit delta [Saccharibacter sp. 17.LH.SD]
MTVAQEKRIRAPGEGAKRYARAFYEYLQEGADIPAVLQQVQALRQVILENDELRSILADPRLDVRRAPELVKALVEGLHLGDEMRRFVGVIARQGRLAALSEILEAVSLLDAHQRGEVRVEVATAQPLDDAQRERLRDCLREAGYNTIAMTERLDASLLGGMTVRVGSVLFDTSIVGRLARLQNAMKGAA